jgi:hypothetical protein
VWLTCILGTDCSGRALICWSVQSSAGECQWIFDQSFGVAEGALGTGILARDR